MPDLIDDRLRALITPPDPEPALARLHGRTRRRRNSRRALGGVALALVLLAGTMALTRSGDDTTDVHVGPSTDSGEAGWSDLPMPPVVSITGSAWAGDQLVTWGPTEAGASEQHVFGFDEATSSWEPLRPGYSVHATSAVWTGEQLLFLSAEGISLTTGTATEALPAVAWTPSSDEWATVSSQPTPCAGSPTWTGTYVVTACTSAGGEGAEEVGTPSLHRLDPEDGTWVPAAAPPMPLVVSAGLEMSGGPPALARRGDDVVLVAHPAGASPEDPFALVYDPGADQWAELPGGLVPLTTRDGLISGSAALAVTPTADGLLVVGGDRTAARYVEDEGRWEQLDEIPTRYTLCRPSVVLAGDTPVADLCSGVAALGPDGTWTTTAYPSGELYGLESRLLAGEDAALLVGSVGLDRYRSPTPDVDGQIPFRSPVPLDEALLEVPNGAEVRSVEIVVPELGPNEDVFTYEEQLVAAVVLADGDECTVTTGAAFRGESRGVGVEVHGIEGSLSQSAEGSTVRWSWTPGTAWHQVQVTCPTDAQALALAELVRYPDVPDP